MQSTKLFKRYRQTGSIIAFPINGAYIVAGLRKALDRLQFEYVDEVFSYRPDYETPLEGTYRTMKWVIEQGRAFYWRGTFK